MLIRPHNEMRPGPPGERGGGGPGGFMIIQRFVSLWCNQPATLSAEAARQSAVKVAKTASTAIAREISGLKVAACILYSNEPRRRQALRARPLLLQL